MALFSPEDEALIAKELAPKAAPAGAYGDARATFIRDNGALADRVGADLGIDPDALLGQWGLETGWGKSVIPGTNNLGNIKDFSGRGVAATDNMTGSRDKYRQYASLDDFGDDFAGLVGRRYPAAMGSGQDTRRYATALKAAGYAEDPAYVDKLVATTDAVKRLRGTLSPGKERPASVRYFDPADQPGASPADFERDTRRTEAARSAGATVGDLAREFGASAVSGLGDILGGAGEAGAAAMNAWTGTEDYEGFNPLKKPAEAIRNGMTEGGKLARASGFDGDLMQPETWKAPESVSGWLMTGANGLGSLLPSILPALGPSARAARLAAAGDAAGAAAASATAKVTGAAAGGLMTGGNAAGDARQNVGKALDAMSHDELMAQVPIYREAFEKSGDARTARNAVENAAAQYAGMGAGLMGAAGGAFNAKIIEDLIAHKGVSAVLGALSNRATVRGAVGAAAGMAGEGGQEVSEGVGQAMGENYALGRPVGQDATRGSFGNFVGGAMVGGAMGGAGGVLSRAAAHAPAPQPGVAPTVAPAAAAEGVPGGAAPGAGPESSATEAVDPFTARVNAIRDAFPSFMAGKDPALRDEALYALMVASNPEARQDLREKALTQLESVFSGVGNFTMPPNTGGDAEQPAAGGDLVPVAAPQRAAGPGLPDETGQIIDGEVREVPPAARTPAGLPQPPVGTLPAPVDGAERARYEQEFADLVKTDQIDRSLSELEDKARTLFQESMRERDGSARLAEIQQAIEHNRAERTREERARLLSDVLADPAVENHAERFTAQLARAGFRDITPTPDELAKIARFNDLRAALNAPPEVVPSAPNELDPYIAAPAPKAAPASNVQTRREAIRAALAAGQKLEKRADGTYLVNPETGEERKLSPAEAQMARNELAKRVATAAADTNTEPTEAQVAANNYRKARIKFQGLPIAIENPKGSTRSGVSPEGKRWESTMAHHYGEVERSEGADGDPVDVFIGPDPTSQKVFVVDQIDPKTGAFDEHKAMLGFTTEAAARAGYLANYEDGWQGLGAISEMPLAEFKTWLKDGNTRQPIEPRAVRAGEGAATVNPAQVAQDEPEAHAESGFYARIGDHFEAIPASAEPRLIRNLSPLVPELEFVLHKSLADKPKDGEEWVLTEVSTGTAFRRGPSPDAVILAAQQLIEKVGAACVRAAISSALASTGHAPAPKEESNESDVGSGADSGADGARSAGDDTAQGVDSAEAVAPEGQDAAVSPMVSGDGSVPAASDTADSQPALTKSVKWYGTRERAERHVAENGLADTHKVVNPAGTKRFEVREKAGIPVASESPAPLDHGVLNIPGRTSTIDAELDRYKAEQQKQAKADAKVATAESKAAKARAKELFSEVGDGLVAAYGGKYDEKEFRAMLDSMVKWEPKKFILVAEQFKAERGEASRDAADGAAQVDGVPAGEPSPDVTESPASDPAEEQPEPVKASKTPTLDAHVDFMGRVRNGEATADQLRQEFERTEAQRDAIASELSGMKKEDILRSGGFSFHHRFRDSKKAEIVAAMVDRILGEFALGRSYGPSTYVLSADGMAAMGQQKAQALRDLVASTTDDDLRTFAQNVAASRAEADGRRAAAEKSLHDPETLDDFRAFFDNQFRQGLSRHDAYLRLTPDQRQLYDDLEAEQTRASRDERKAALRNQGIRAAGQATTGEIIETKHTRDGHDLFVVQLGERVSREDYETLSESAKRIGGWYSKFRGNGAVPGFQFKTRDAAQAFSKLVSGDTEDALAVAQARRDAFDDDRSQSAAERLRTMAAALDARAEASLALDRKANTERRARFASNAEAAARADKALAGTMSNIATAIQDGKARFLDAVRQKVQVEFLANALRTAKDEQIRAKYPSYGEQQKHAADPIDAETVDYARFPAYTVFRSDLATLGRALLGIDGAKKLGQRLMSVADDVTTAYVEWAKENLLRVSHFGRGDRLADFSSRDDAERAIRRSGLADRAIVLPIKRGVNRVVLSPSEAMKLGLWEGDGDKRITLTADFGRELVEAVGRRARGKVDMPWQLENAYDKRKRLEGMGIYTPSEYRAALREFSGLQEAMATPDKIKEMERAMVGRRNDGLDFLPTSRAVTDQMLEAADIQPGMSVLEPSAGMGHIADVIREQTGVEPDVAELSGERRELLAAKGYHLVGTDFTTMEPRKFFTFGDVFRAPDGTEGIMHGGPAWSGRVSLHAINEDGSEGRMLGWFDRDEVQGVSQRGSWSGYDRIIMNPPFSKGRDIAHVRHAYNLLRPGGRLVAIMGEGAFFQQNKGAEGFRAWLEEHGGTSEKLPEGSFLDSSLPVTTGANARMVVIDKPLDASPITEASEEADTAVFRADPEAAQGVSVASDAARDAVDTIRAKYQAAPAIHLVDSFAELPDAVKAQAAEQGVSGAAAKGIFHDGAIYLVRDSHMSAADLEATVYHELVGHYGVRKMLGPDFIRGLNGIFAQLGGIAGLRAIAERRGFGPAFQAYIDRLAQAREQDPARYSDAMVKAILSEEMFAHIAEQQPTLMDRVKALVGKLRAWLRDHGFASLAELGETDLLHMLDRSRAGLENDPDDDPSGGRPAEEGMPAVFRAAAAGDQDAMGTLRDRVRQQVADTFTSQRTFNRWWHKTVGTQYHKAQVDPEGFGRVYSLAQQYIDDVARYASEAADRAEGLLPKLETARDAIKGMFTVRRDATDAKAIAKPIFDGTLSEKVYSDSALRRDFGLTDRQIDLYREFRAAVDKSLDDLAISEMGRLAKASKLRVAPKGLMLKQAAKFYFDQFSDELETAQQELADKQAAHQEEASLLEQAGADTEADRGEYADQVSAMRRRQEAEIEPILARVAELERMRAGFEGKAEQIEDLKRKGYAPLTRFGQYTVDVFLAGEDGKPLKDADGMEIRPFFGMFETQAEANQAARALQGEYPEATVKQGVLSQNAYSLFKGVTPETVELLAGMMGEEQSEAFQRYLKTAVSNRSALKRLIARKGIAGYSEDPTRVLAAFLTSNARAAAANDHMGDMLKAAADIPRDRGDAKDEAVNLVGYLQNPGEEASKLRGLLFVNYIGGSVASALVNMTQTFTMTYPYLHQFGGNTAGMVGEAMRLAGRRLLKRDTEIADPALRAALERAMDEGVTSPHEIHMLYGESSRTGVIQGNRYMRNFLKAFGSFFSLAELYNRDVAFIAAYRVAQKQGMEGEAAYEFSKKAVVETQGVYSKANRPNWARGAVGATLFTFKQFSISYLEFLKRLPAKERAIALGILLLFAGMQGMPMADDLDDVIDTIAESMGYSLGSKQAKREFLTNVLGKDAAGFIQYGVSYGLPIDIAGRMSVGNLIPGTGLAKRSSADKSQEVEEVFGAAGGLAQQVSQAVGAAQGGNLGAAALTLAPKAFRDLAKGVDMLSTGQYSDSKDRKVADASALDGVMKAIGFQPAHIAESSRARGEVIQQANLARAVESEIVGQWAAGIVRRDPEKVAQAREALAEWNRKNPDAPIAIKPSQVQRRAKDMRATSEDRLLKSVPKEMRGQARAALAG